MRACCSRAARCCWRAGEVRASAIPRTARCGRDELLLRRLADPVACGAFPHSVVGWLLLVAIVDADRCVWRDWNIGGIVTL